MIATTCLVNFRMVLFFLYELAGLLSIRQLRELIAKI